MYDRDQNPFSPGGTQEIDMRGFDSDRGVRNETSVGHGTQTADDERESISSGVHDLMASDPERPETMDAVNSYISKNGDSMTAQEATELRELVEDRKDGDPEKRRAALEVIYGLESAAESQAEQQQLEAEAKKVSQTVKLMDTWEKQIAAQGNMDGVDVMKQEYGAQLDKWANQIAEIQSDEADNLRGRIAQARTEFLRGRNV